jgi:multidrug efflux pump subunit AcrA (membrane-fusion protein)
MTHNKLSALLPLLIAALLISGCAPGAAAPQSAATPTAAPDASGITAEGRLEPLRYVELSPAAAGSVSQLSVKEGDTVEPGQVIALIQGDQTRTLEQAQAEAAAELADANQAVRKAQTAFDDFDVPARFAGMKPEQAAAQSLTALDAARLAFEPYKGTERLTLKTIKPWFRTWTPSIWLKTGEYEGVAKGLKKQLDLAWVDYRRAILWLQLESALESAQVRLAQAQQDFDSLQDASLAEDTAGVRLALASAELRAPFAGTVTNLDLKLSQFVSPGASAVTVADFSKWLVKTTDLTEMDVVNVKEGQPVAVTLDAIPAATFNGYVLSIGQSYAEKQGDIVYEVTVLLTDTHPAMRWGMTAAVHISLAE